ncbi:DUF4817 domain-containing protein [Trichonephila clavipes]|nr:DUF4817 domain-containing protein [Trichonephila clavipes]
MLSAPDKALLVKLFYMNEESATIALHKSRVQKNVKSGKGPLTPAGLLKLVKRFEETGKLEDRARAGRPCLKERAPCIAVEMEAIASEAASGRAVHVKLPDDWAYHHHLSKIFFVESSSCTRTNCNRAMNFCQQIPHRGKLLRSGPSLKWNRFPPEFLTSCGQMKLISRFKVTLTTITVTFGRPLIHGYLKSRVYLSGPSSLSELKDAVRREVSSKHPDMLHSAVAGFVTRLECLLPCGGHVEHILV